MSLDGNTTTTNLTMYSEGGAGFVDTFKVSVAEHGATTISTNDAAAIVADLTFSVDGDAFLLTLILINL